VTNIVAKAEMVNKGRNAPESNENTTTGSVDMTGIMDQMARKAIRPTRPKLISIEGIPGSRKSDIIDALCEKYDVHGTDVVILREPLIESSYITSGDLNLRDGYFKYPAQYGLPFQILYFLTVEKQIREAIAENITKRVIVFERSLLTARHVYMPMLKDKILSVQYDVYQKLFEGGGSKARYA